MYIGLEGGTSNTVGILFGDTDNHTQSRIQHNNSDNSLKFSTVETERMRIDASGNMMIGVTSGNSSNAGSLTIGHAGITKITGAANGNADELILIGANASANVGMSIISNNANQGIIYFGDEDDILLSLIHI